LLVSHGGGSGGKSLLLARAYKNTCEKETGLGRRKKGKHYDRDRVRRKGQTLILEVSQLLGINRGRKD